MLAIQAKEDAKVSESEPSNRLEAHGLWQGTDFLTVSGGYQSQKWGCFPSTYLLGGDAEASMGRFDSGAASVYEASQVGCVGLAWAFAVGCSEGCSAPGCCAEIDVRDVRPGTMPWQVVGFPRKKQAF